MKPICELNFDFLNKLKKPFQSLKIEYDTDKNNDQFQTSSNLSRNFNGNLLYWMAKIEVEEILTLGKLSLI